jgi:hypothetical protein
MTGTARDLAVPADPDVAQAAIEFCYQQGWSDGLPLVPASRPLVDQFLATTKRDAEEVIGSLEQVGRDCTVYLAAVNAAMAGCKPEYFPVVLAAFDALMRERAARGGGFQSTSGPAPLIIVNGPVRTELEFNTTGGTFGPGFRPNMTIPRAIGLIVRNAFGIHPHVLEQATQGVPGRWSICVAENEEESPWGPLAQDAGVPGGVSAVSVTLTRTMEFIDNRHSPDPEDVLRDIADSVGRLGPQIFPQTPVALVLCPEHAQMFANAGLSKADVQDWLIGHAGRAVGDMRRAGKGGTLRQRGPGGHGEAAGALDDEEFHRVLSERRQVPVIVAGARTAAISMVVRIFGEWSGQAVPVSEWQ